MWIVHLALRRPYTFIVMAILIAILGAVSIVTMPTDIFPYINIPVVGVIWSYQGMSPDDMAKRVLVVSERAMTTTVKLSLFALRLYLVLMMLMVFYHVIDLAGFIHHAK